MVVIRPFSLFVVGFNSTLTTATRVRTVSRFIRTRCFLVVAEVPSRRNRGISGHFKRMATLTVAEEGLATLQIVPFRQRRQRTRTIAIALTRLTITFQFRGRDRIYGPKRHIFPFRVAMRRCIGQNAQRPFFAASRVHRFRRVVIRSVNRVMDERLIN